MEFSFYLQIVVVSCSYPGVIQESCPKRPPQAIVWSVVTPGGLAGRVSVLHSISMYSSRNVGVRRLGAGKKGRSDRVWRMGDIESNSWWSGREACKWVFAMSELGKPPAISANLTWGKNPLS